jgi:hypothetical protein
MLKPNMHSLRPLQVSSTIAGEAMLQAGLLNSRLNQTTVRVLAAIFSEADL